MHILSVSFDVSALTTRNKILEQAGYRVVTTTKISEALRRFSKSETAAVVIGDSIPVEERISFVRALRAISPVIPALCVCGGHAGNPADLNIICVDKFSPEHLLKALADAIDDSARASGRSA